MCLKQTRQNNTWVLLIIYNFQVSLFQNSYWNMISGSICTELYMLPFFFFYWALSISHVDGRSNYGENHRCMEDWGRCNCGHDVWSYLHWYHRQISFLLKWELDKCHIFNTDLRGNTYCVNPILDGWKKKRKRGEGRENIISYP